MDLDSNLAAHEDHLQYRYDLYLKTKEAIEKAEGSLEEFAKVGTVSYGTIVIDVYCLGNYLTDCCPPSRLVTKPVISFIYS